MAKYPSRSTNLRHQPPELVSGDCSVVLLGHLHSANLIAVSVDTRVLHHGLERRHHVRHQKASTISSTLPQPPTTAISDIDKLDGQ